ncbi:MAG: hypothetical protein ACK5JR_02245 [Tropicimonas sp.]|uniref:hypothetical protein n=1 Tax=Tropicimonas sp. TaxID=2067044 RepID=UPI003A8B1AAB
MRRPAKSARPGRFAALWGAISRLLLGRRFMLSLERNREAADRLDAALKEMLRQ